MSKRYVDLGVNEALDNAWRSGQEAHAPTDFIAFLSGYLGGDDDSNVLSAATTVRLRRFLAWVRGAA